jgi:hypothetical protein
MEILQLSWSRRCLLVNTPQLDSQLNCSQSQSYIATDGQSVSKSWCRAPSGAHDQIFITVWQLRSCFCGALPSLTSGGVCLSYILLGLASAVFLGSESLGTRDHILLSQDYWSIASIGFKITPPHRPRWKHSPSIVVEACLLRRCMATIAARTT